MFSCNLSRTWTQLVRSIIKPTAVACRYSTGIKDDPISGQEEQETEIIIDVYKERLKKYAQLLEEQEEESNKFGDLNLSRGVDGVFDIEDLVETLKHQQAEDIFVASVPKEIGYVDYIVVASSKSQRHMNALTQFVKQIYKQKKLQTDIMPTLEGKNSSDWMAMDMDNIALHIFSKSARAQYDLDTLWAVGSKYDDQSHKKDLLSSMLERHAFSLKGFVPAK
ncbi:hypothetical protein YQE_07614, partial [Dendroctonus ponderosae]